MQELQEEPHWKFFFAFSSTKEKMSKMKLSSENGALDCEHGRKKATSPDLIRKEKRSWQRHAMGALLFRWRSNSLPIL